MAKSNLRKSIYSPEHQVLKFFLIELRKKLSHSQREFAVRLSVGHSYIAKIETGERRLDVIEFYDLMSALIFVQLNNSQRYLKKLATSNSDGYYRYFYYLYSSV
jgi:transcriptional regulator with XRE-family HTH domain